ncbi:MAG TPA: hypothetical protein VNV44_05960 [Solirubrobacteraceae bacterium]|nr:hypothetical protein [Solirubrobacteraceae bacterium]
MPAILLLLAATAAGASAAPFELRVEGSAKTLYEGPVSPGPETFETATSPGLHPCNVTANTGIPGPELGNATTALREVALAQGLAFDAEWFGSEKPPAAGEFFVNQVGADRNESAPPFDSWGVAVNDVLSEIGGCEFAPEAGAEVLWAYNVFNLAHMLRLSGPATAEVGVPFTVHVVDGTSGAALSGATLGEDTAGVTSPLPGSPGSDASGNASVVLSHAGAVTLKATRADSVRSNGLTVCVHAAGDGGCGSASATGGVAGFTSALPAPYKGPYALVAHLASVVNGRHYTRHGAPRLLAGQVSSHSSVTTVSLSLRRSYKGRCWAYDGVREAFARSRCGSAKAFKVASSASFSYLLPGALKAGRYVLDVTGSDVAGNTIALARGTSRVVFYVG